MKRFLFVNIVILLGLFGCNDDIFSPNGNSKIIRRSDSTVVSMKYGETIVINDELTIEFTGVPADSRCPIDAICVWAGDGEVKLMLRKDNLSKTLSLHTTLDPKVILFDNYEIQLIHLLPSRKASEQITQDQYSVELKIKYINSQGTKPVYFIDANSEWLISNHPVTINELYIDKDELNISVSYSGGCKEHQIDLFAYTGIMKSNPPQMSLVVSHNGNGDMCQAYLTNKIKCDLKKLKAYLGGSGIYDKVILNIAGPDGKQIKQSPVIYSLK